MSIKLDVEQFLESVQGIMWFSKSGCPINQAHVPEDFVAALDGSSKAQFELWSHHTHELEAAAQGLIGDEAITRVFKSVSEAVRQGAWSGICKYLDRMRASDPTFDETGVNAGLALEVLDLVKRDLAWAAVEHVLARPAFFTALLDAYRAGRWPCDWRGPPWPDGKPVLF